MVTDPPYGIELDSEWRDRAGLNTAPGQQANRGKQGGRQGQSRISRGTERT